MKHTPAAPLPTTKTLDEQKVDFTSEGAPPPGKAGQHVPAPAPKGPDTTLHVPVPNRK